MTKDLVRITLEEKRMIKILRAFEIDPNILLSVFMEYDKLKTENPNSIIKIKAICEKE